MKLNQPAPEFTLPDAEGRIHMLSDYRSKIVIAVFWSVECPHSERADRALLAAIPDWGEEVVYLSIASNSNESKEMIKQASLRRNLSRVLWDADHSVADRYEALTTPHAFLIGGQGILRYHGAVDDVSLRQREPTRYYLKDAVEALLAGRFPEPAETQPFGCTIVRHP